MAEAPHLKKILVASDFSETADAALEEAALLARLADADVVLLNVCPVPDLGIPTGIDLSWVPSWSAVRDMFKERMKAVESTLEDERRRLAERGVRVAVEVREGHPAAEIARAAEEVGADLIVMGTHGRRGFSHFFLGSTSEQVIRTSPCPVLLVRAKRAGS